MLARQMQKAISWLPHVVAVSSALVIGLLFWPVKEHWPEWKPSKRIPIGFVETRPGTLAWKQPILPIRTHKRLAEHVIMRICPKRRA